VYTQLAGARATIEGGRAVFAQRSTCTRDAAELVAALARRVRLRANTYKLLRVRDAAARPALSLALRPESLARLLPAVAGAEAQTGSARGSGGGGGGGAMADSPALPPPPPPPPLAPPPPLPRLLARRVEAGNPAASAAPYDYGVYATSAVPPCELLAEYRCARRCTCPKRDGTRKQKQKPSRAAPAAPPSFAPFFQGRVQHAAGG
jgi:hypothetical protein